MRSQNGWLAVTSGSSSKLTNLSWVTGKVRTGDVHTVFDELGRRFDAEVEKITVPHSWGYAYRDIRGASSLSNHASGTAVDFNAPKHPLGKVGTFSARQQAAIERILRDLDGVVRWGGHYSGRKDEMHFEIWANEAQLAAVARKIKGGSTLAPDPTPKDWFAMATEKDLKNALTAWAKSKDGRTALAGAFTVDGVLKSPSDTNPDNTHWTVEGYLRSIRSTAQRAEARAAAAIAALDALAGSVGADPADIRKTVEAAVEKSLADLSITLTNEKEG